MLLPHVVVGIFSMGITVLGVGEAMGQTYPNRPIRIITATAGGSPDFVARIIAPGISSPLGQPIGVDNRPSNVLGELLTKAPPDGHTLLLAGNSSWLAPLLQPMPYDPVKDFAPIAQLVASPQLLAASPTLSVNSVAELIAVAKSKPGALNYASGSSGGSGHLTSELFKALAGVNIVRVAYKTTSLAYGDMVSGQVHMMFENPAQMIPHVKAGKMRALAVTSLKPTPLVPGVPPLAATLPGFEYLTVVSIFAPAKTPEAVIKQLNQEIVRFLSRNEVKEQFFNAGVEVVGSSPQNLGAAMSSEITSMGKIIRDAGIKAD